MAHVALAQANGSPRTVATPARQEVRACSDRSSQPQYTGAMTAAIDPTSERPGEEPDADDGADLPNLPLLDDAIEHDAAAEVKPTWRGWIHAGTFPLAIVLGIVLLVLADGMAARVSGAVFFASSLLLFGVSALYHRFNWSPTIKRLLKRADHSNIFLLIAGTYTPLAVLCLPESKATLLLWLVWGGAALGIGFRVLWVGAPRWLYVPLYLLLGLGRRDVHGRLLRGELGHDDPRDRRRAAATRRAPSSTASSGRTRSRASSASTRSSTRRRCSRSCATGPASSSWRSIRRSSSGVQLGRRCPVRSAASARRPRPRCRPALRRGSAPGGSAAPCRR